MTGLVHLVTKQYSRIFAVLMILTLLVVTPAAAQICWGKICTVTTCCGGHGACVGFNNCLCNAGYSGVECENPTFCGTCTNTCGVTLEGSCDIPGPTGTCHCAPGYDGTCCDEHHPGFGYPAPYAFGNVRTGTTATMSSPVIFAADHPNIMVKSIAISGANAGDFTLSGGTCTPDTYLTGTGGCTGEVTFTPSASGSRTADMAVTFSYPDYYHWPSHLNAFWGTGYEKGWGNLNGQWWLSSGNLTFDAAETSTLTGTGFDVPAVTGISPATGPAAGGTVVTITGTGFSGAEHVSFGPVPNATGAMTVDSDTSITVTSPAGTAGAADITVTNPVSTSSVVPAGRFTYTGPATPTPVPTTVSGSGFAIGSGGSDSDGSTGAGPSGAANGNSPQGSQKAPLQDESTPVNVGGSTAVTSVIVYGNGNSGAVVTATSLDGPPAGASPPPGSSVYSYLEISPARTGTVTEAEISFAVSQSWLAEHHLAPEQVVMYHYVGGQWVALPTTVVRSANGQVYFSATTPSFSPFAIGVAETQVSVPATTTAPATFGSLAAGSMPAPGAVQTPALPAAVPQPTGTVAPPAPAATQPAFPLAAIAMIGAGCLVLIGGGWYVRRWWIRRQNPALFMEDD